MRRVGLVFCSLSILFGLLLGSASAAERRAKQPESRRPTARTWHPGAIGDPLSSWTGEPQPGLQFRYDNGWDWSYQGRDWGFYYDDGNTRFRYSRGGYWVDPGYGRRSTPWLRPDACCAGCGQPPAACYCGACWQRTDAWASQPCRRYLDRRQELIIFGGPASYGYDRVPALGDPLMVDGSPLLRQPGGSIVNNYYGDVYYGSESANQDASRIPQEDETEDRPATPVVLQDAPRVLGTLFYESARLRTPIGARVFSLSEGKLSSHLEGAKPVTVDKGIDATYGALAVVDPAAGASVVYLKGGVLFGAYQTAADKWWSEPLPFGQAVASEVSLGLVGGEVWAAFTAEDGARYLYVWTGRLWREIGSATQPKS